MNSPVEQESFEDPPLKRVCRSAWAGEKCPLALLERLRSETRRAALQTSRSALQPAQPIRLPQPVWANSAWGLAAAAVVLLGVGIVFRPFQSPANVASASVLNPKITQSMVAMHDKCCKAKKHQTSEAKITEVAKTGEVLGRRLGQPVVACSIPEGGWAFHGGVVCPVDNVPAAHLIFKRGQNSVSVFSMPAKVSPAQSTHHGSYEGTYEDHAIAGFVDSRGAFCLVGSGDNLNQQRLAAMRDRIQSTVVSSPLPPSVRHTVVHAELLQALP